MSLIPRRRAEDKRRDADRERQRQQIRDMEARALRITSGPGGRCFRMPEGHLLAILNEPQPTDGDLMRIMHIVPVTTADAEDFLGWSGPAWT